MQADAEDLPFKNERFDMVTSMGCLHHTPNTQKGIDEIYRVVKKNGKFVSSLYYKNFLLRKPVFPSFIYILKLLKVRMHGIDKLGGKVSLQEFINYYDGRGNPLGKVYSKIEVKEMFSKFADIKTEIHYFPIRFLPFHRFIPDILIKYLDRYLGFMIYIKGYKR